MADELPAAPGCYVLWLHLATRHVVAIGKRGTVALPGGYYGYAGSAHGSGGLRARIQRHLRGGSVRHWHVDYLRAVANVAEAWMWPDAPSSDECRLAAELTAAGGGLAAGGFGSSDCRCPGHLVGPFTAIPPRVVIGSVGSSIRGWWLAARG